MKTTHKAKDLNGNWVEGWYYFFDHIHYLRCVNDKGFHEDYRINPSTLCERVRGTDFFEWDEVEHFGFDMIGNIEFDNDLLQYWVYHKNRTGFALWSELRNIKQTGRNRHDND